MRHIILIGAVLFTSLAAGAQTQDDDAAIRQSIEYMEEGWTKKDGNLFATGFADNADYVVINGMFIQGKKGIAEGHQRIFSSIYRETMVAIDVQSIRYLRPDIAIAHVKAHMTGTSMGKKIDHEAMITVVLEKKDGSWKITAFQNTEIEATSKDEE
jgi:uncharacterized protein (TIGR02246 family)